MTVQQTQFGGESDVPTLYTLASEMLDTPNGFGEYDGAKAVWLGNPHRAVRLDGDHPWPTRTRAEQEYVYSVPVFAAVAPELKTVLYVGKDAWKADEDPNAWLVAERHLFSGREFDHRVLGASVDAARHLWLQLAPSNYGNMPPQARDALYRQPPHAQIRLEGRLDSRYSLERATLQDGCAGRRVVYEDVEALEAMIILVRQMRELSEQESRQRGVISALGHRSTVWDGVAHGDLVSQAA